MNNEAIAKVVAFYPVDHMPLEIREPYLRLVKAKELHYIAQRHVEEKQKEHELAAELYLAKRREPSGLQEREDKLYLAELLLEASIVRVRVAADELYQAWKALSEAVQGKQLLVSGTGKTQALRENPAGIAHNLCLIKARLFLVEARKILQEVKTPTWQPEVLNQAIREALPSWGLESLLPTPQDPPVADDQRGDRDGLHCKEPGIGAIDYFW